MTYKKTTEIPTEIWKWLHENSLNFRITFHGFAYPDWTNTNPRWTVKAALVYADREAILIRVKPKDPTEKLGILEMGYAGWGSTPNEAFIQLFFFLQNTFLAFNKYRVEGKELPPEILVPDFGIVDEEHVEKYKNRN